MKVLQAPRGASLEVWRAFFSSSPLSFRRSLLSPPTPQPPCCCCCCWPSATAAAGAAALSGEAGGPWWDPRPHREGQGGGRGGAGEETAKAMTQGISLALQPSTLKTKIHGPSPGLAQEPRH